MKTILVVDSDDKKAALLEATVCGAVPAEVARFSTGETAVSWLTSHECALALIQYKLPGMDGLQTMVRAHQYQPDLPVILMSPSRNEEVPISAFHSGAFDFIPTHGKFEQRAVAAVRRAFESLADGVPVALVMPGTEEDEIVLIPSYENRLRVIGRQLDVMRYRSVNILEVTGGFVVRAMPSLGRAPEAMEFTDRDFPVLVRDGIMSRGEKGRVRASVPYLPTGYEDFLRALGHRLDEKGAEAVTIAELEGLIAVSMVTVVNTYESETLAPSQLLLGAEEISALLDRAYQRRR